MRYLILGFVALVFFSCSTKATKEETMQDQMPSTEKPKTELNGVWTDGSGPNASFSIHEDQIRDVEHNTVTKMLFRGDSVTFLDPDPNAVYSAKMYLIHSDTLIYEYHGVKTKYWRFTD